MDNNFLTKQEHGFLQQVQCFFDELQLGMSAFQIKHFVLNDEAFPLPDSKYHQAKLELHTRWQKIVDLEFSHKKNLAQIKLLIAQQQKWRAALSSDIDYECAEAAAQIEILQIDIEQLSMAETFLQKNVSETFREMRIFHEVLEAMQGQLGYDSKEAAEAEHWHIVQTIRAQQAAMDDNEFQLVAKGTKPKVAV